MPGGLLGLVAYGNMNRLISGNPQTTYFYKAFTRYTHYSQENITVPLDGPNELSLTAPIQLRAKIPRHGDLLADAYLTVQLPAIYNKILPSRISHEFAWVRQIGIRMIDRVGLYIGGSKVQEYSSDWLAMKFQLDQPLDAFEKWSSMIGDRPELFDPASGPYADPSGGYPNVVNWPAIGPNQINNPSIPAQTLNIPLGFFFSEAPGLALPLVALQYHDVEIQITMRPLRELYTIKDENGVRSQWGYQLDSATGTLIYNQSWNQNTGKPLPESLNNNYIESYDPSGSPRYFYTDHGYGIPASDGFQMNPRLQCTYIFLTDEERRIFASKRLEYIVRQVQEFRFQNISARRALLIDAHSLISRFIWFARRSDWYYRNDYANLTNWKYTDPQLRPLAKNPTATKTNSGITIPGTAKNIMTSARILCGGNEIFEEKDASYFSAIVPYKTCLGNGYPYLLGSIMESVSLSPIYVYSFALNGSIGNQPSGTFNSSKITRTELEVNVQQLPPDANYSYNFWVYAESLNFLEIGSGMGGMKFAI